MISLSVVGVARAQDKPRELSRIAASADKTAAALATSPVSWTAESTLGSGAVIAIDWLQSGDRKLLTFHLTLPGGRKNEVLRIIMRDGLWYVADVKGRYKHRPYEYPAETPFIYLCLARAFPKTLHAKDIAGMTVAAIDGDIVTLRRPLPPGIAAQIKGALAKMEDAGQPAPLDAGKIAQLKAMLHDGYEIKTDQTVGIVTENGGSNLTTQIKNLAFLQAVDEQKFSVVGDWEDRSDDPTVGDLNDLVMIAHDSRVQPGGKQYDLDARLVNVKTGRFRRIPFLGGVAMPGCFLKDRTSLIVCGTDPDTMVLRPFRIDLKTGKNMAVGTDLLDGCLTMHCDISPDGRTLLVTALNVAKPLKTWSELYTVDLATNETKPFGKPLDTAGAQWTADGKQAVMLSRKYDNEAQTRPRQTIVLMDAEGTIQTVRDGNLPMVMADRKSVLYEDSATDLLYTCDLEGKNVKLFADGMKGYGFVAPGPDGKRILMMKFRPGQLPQPMVITIGQAGERLAVDAPGLWGMPVWR